jgi:hypothetical protein
LHDVRGRSVLECRTVHDGRTVLGPIADGPLLRVQYWRFGGCFRTAHRIHTDSPPRPRGLSARYPRTVHPGLADGPSDACGQSAWSSAELLSLLLFEFLFRFRIVWGLLLGLVGPL